VDLQLGDIIVVTGTDTAVGKTVTTAALAADLRARGLRVRALKPVQTGVEPGSESDADLIARGAGHPPLAMASLAEPLSPHLALERAGLALGRDDILDWIAFHRGEITLVEGSGGWEVPLCRDFTVADLAVALGARVLLVAQNRLGVLNHACLSARAISARGLVTWRVALSPGTGGLAVALNETELPRLLPGHDVRLFPSVDINDLGALARAGRGLSSR